MTGVQTCALPICSITSSKAPRNSGGGQASCDRRTEGGDHIIGGMRADRVMLSKSCTMKQKEDARRRAVDLVLLRQGLMKEITDVSTYLKAKTRTI